MTTPLFKKLNHKGQDIVIINAPDEFKPEMEAIKKAGNKVNSIGTNALSSLKEIGFILSFVQTKKEIEKLAASIDKKLVEDAVVWFAYPKGTSKKYKAEINRDNGWEPLGKEGFDTVRSVAIDNDWTGLRFRKNEFIKVMKRNPTLTLSEKGKTRAKKK
ncbi:MAG TPA: hypothetical protein VFF27_12825 [Bacteroidia bacterium]|jgi:hypothetical protein|nr:hypothetical protein [Bacteroidia bacterium]